MMQLLISNLYYSSFHLQGINTRIASHAQVEKQVAQLVPLATLTTTKPRRRFLAITISVLLRDTKYK